MLFRSSENEHALDAMNLALLIFAQKYDKLLRRVFSTKAVLIDSVLDKRNFGAERDFLPNQKNDNEDSIVKIVRTPGSREGVVSIMNPQKSNHYPSSFNRAVSFGNIGNKYGR